MARNDKAIDPTLVKAIDKLLKEVTLEKKDGQGKQKYTFMDVKRAIELKLQLEKLKHDIKDDGYGAGFDDIQENAEEVNEPTPKGD